MPIHPDRRTRNKLRLALLAAGEPERLHPQSRFCVTLCADAELFERKVRGLIPGPDGPVLGGIAPQSHADLFGPFAIGFNPLVARRLGIMPTHYYAPGDMFGSRIVDRKSAVPGLSSQLIQRLKELRELMVVLALIEATPQPKSGQVADRARLRALGLDLPFEPGILAQIDALSREESDRVYELFSTDRDAAYHLVSFIDMMLSLFQQTDSPINGAVLAFYEQREWRLIHHMREGQEWYCLAGQPLFRDRNAIHRQPEIAELRKLCDRFAHEPRSEDYFEHCWLLEEVDGEEVHAYIDCIVAPSSALASVRDLARREGCRAEIIAAEELGFRGSSAQPRGWRGWRPAAPRR